MSALVEAFVDAGADPDVRAIVVTGAGNRAFSGGADLKARREADQAGKPFVYLMSAKQRFLFEVIHETYKPVIAAINRAARWSLIPASTGTASACCRSIA
jgi:enoyl-CoA hydratase